MKLRIRTFVLLSAVFLTVAPSAFSQTTVFSDTSKLEKHISFLKNKYFIDFPASAKVSPRVADIMATDPNENRETRVIIDQGNMRLVFFAQELFALHGKNLFEDVSREAEPDFDFKRKILTNTDSLLTVLSTPTRFDTAATAILVNSLLVRSPDNTVSRIDVYINPDAISQKEDYTRLTEKVLATISKGSRRIDLAAKQETQKVFGTDSKFNFQLPKNYFVTVDEKYDFAVYKINKYKNSLSDTTYTGITIYTGRFPSYFYKEYGYTADKAVTTKGLFLQNPVDWLYLRDDAQHFYLKEQFIPSDNIQKGLILHVAMLSNKKEVIDELTKIVESIRITN